MRRFSIMAAVFGALICSRDAAANNGDPFDADRLEDEGGLSLWPAVSFGGGTDFSARGASDGVVDAPRLDAGLGATVHVHGGRDAEKINFLYHPEAGYVFEGGPIRGHWFRWGVGLGAGTPNLHLRYRLAFLGGRARRRGNIGLSHGGVVDVIGGLVAFEVGQQRMRGEAPRLYALATTNIIMIGWIVRSLVRR